MAWAMCDLADPNGARQMARTVLQTAGSRGFQLVSLEARALMAHITEGEERATHCSVGQDLARDFTNGLAPDMALAFMRRPFLKFLDVLDIDPSDPGLDREIHHDARGAVSLDDIDQLDIGLLEDDDLLETEMAPKPQSPPPEDG